MSVKLPGRMETSFYHDDLNQDKMKKPLKRPMTLDFDSSGKKQKTNVLSSPDLNMLKLASPELERMLITSNGMVTTTPTPTQFICPKYVTEEQEAYARGFVEALKELHAKEGPVDPVDPQNVTFVNTSGTDSTCSSSSMGVMAPVAAAPQYTTLTTASTLPVTIMPAMAQPPNSMHNGLSTISEGAMPATVVSQAGPAVLPPMTGSRLMQLKEEEPQTVPCLGNTPPVSPINMEDQERIKLERKRERNRVAARKCRTRKLERISRLEDRVDELKGQNTDLSKTANNLREQVARLKQQIMEHVNGGCQLMISQNLL